MYCVIVSYTQTSLVHAYETFYDFTGKFMVTFYVPKYILFYASKRRVYISTEKYCILDKFVLSLPPKLTFDCKMLIEITNRLQIYKHNNVENPRI